MVAVTDHQNSKEIDLENIAKLMKNRIFVDSRRVLEPYQTIKHGFRYYCVGLWEDV